MSRPWKQLRNLTVSETNKSPVNTLNTKATRSIIVNLNSSWPTVVSQHSGPPNVTEDKLATNRYLVHLVHDDNIIWVVRLNVLSVSLTPWKPLDEPILLFHSLKSSEKRSLVEKIKTCTFFGYQFIALNEWKCWRARWLFITSYPTRSHWIIVK